MTYKPLEFSNIDEFIQYISENNINFLELNIQQKIKEPTSVQTVLKEEAEVVLSFLYDNPKIKAKLGESNILYVDSIQVCENACMPIKLNILKRDILINVCNENGIIHSNLNISIDNNKPLNILFEIRKKENNEFLLELNRKLIED